MAPYSGLDTYWLRVYPHLRGRYAATVSVRGLLVAEIQVFVPYRIHPSIISSRRPVVVVVVNMISILTLASLQGAERS